MNCATKTRLAELVIKAIKLAYDKNIPPDTPFMPESIGATPEEFDALIEFLNSLDGDDDECS